LSSQGFCGTKTKRGFYTYPEPAYARDDFLQRPMNKRKKWVRADKLQPGDRVQGAKGNIVIIKEVSPGIFPGSILITLQESDPDFLYLESDTEVFVE
jgi:hypothetical protein